MKPWREIAIPHADVLKGTFQQADFAADISSVLSGKAPPQYQNPVAFFERTYITEGMRLLLTQVAQRLSGRGGEPVIQLQTAFGGGKTHTMLAVWHLATRDVALADLAGVPSLVERAGLMDVPHARVAVIDGTAHGPGQPWKHGRTTIRTLWGELAWQFGGADGLALVKEADANGTSPGKETLRQLLETYAPCVILIDELVAYVRQFGEGQSLSGGTYESNLSFVQALTEAAKLVPTAVVLASLPESDLEAGGVWGERARAALEKVFGRVQALWKPVASEEGFEIVRRRLFEPIRDTAARDAVCAAFTATYAAEGERLPSEVQESRYRDRLAQAYPIHPEVFDRLYEDWATVEGFQKTRGVLKLMAQVIARLWKDSNRDLMILPGSLPLADPDVRNEMTYLFSQRAWEPVIERDIDGDRAETTELEGREPRLGQVNAARRVARTLFLGTAPASVATKPGIRGMDRARIVLGCLQPGQSSAVFSDALNRLLDRLHYLNATGDKAAETTRYWFDTRPNLRREMEDRKRRFDETEVRKKIEEVVRKQLTNSNPFGGVHVFTPHADVPDDSALRLVILPPEIPHMKEMGRLATEAALEYTRMHGNQPRHRSNRLLFLAADQASLPRLRDVTRVWLAWTSIVEDEVAGVLNIDQSQKRQATEETRQAAGTVVRVARDCYKWLLCPTQDDPLANGPTVETFPLNTSGGQFSGELERVCRENELVIDVWSPIHLRERLRTLHWAKARTHYRAMAFWEDTLRFIYLPRLKNREVLASAIRDGAISRDFFGVAHGEAEGRYEGFGFGDSVVSFNDTLLLIEPTTATKYAAALEAARQVIPTPAVVPTSTSVASPVQRIETTGAVPASPSARTFHGSVDVNAAGARMRLVQIAEEIIALLVSDPNARVRVTVEIEAEFPGGAGEGIRRAVTENATSLGFRAKEWE